MHPLDLTGLAKYCFLHCIPIFSSSHTIIFSQAIFFLIILIYQMYIFLINTSLLRNFTEAYCKVEIRKMPNIIILSNI